MTVHSFGGTGNAPFDQTHDSLCELSCNYGSQYSGLLQVAVGKLAYWSYVPLITAIGIGLVAILEHIRPYEQEWLVDHDDTVVDILHATLSIIMIFIAAECVTLFRQLIHISSFWPTTLPIWPQLLVVGLIIDFGLWWMHWLSHKKRFLWRLHALHHSPERLYWLNGERRHPLSALLLAAPGIVCVTLMGAPANVIGAWMGLTAIHLAFQHANLDYSLSYFRHLLGVAEVHRWHHKHGFGRKNLGEFWMIWDYLFGTYYDEAQPVRAGQVGLRTTLPKTYFKQLLWPFKTKNHSGQ